MDTDDKEEFTWQDYAVFGSSLGLSLLIGVFFTWFNCRRNNTKEYLQGGGEMNPVAVGLSMTASVMNAIFLIGIPTEIYYYGTVYVYQSVAFLICLAISCLLFIPFYRYQNAISIHQYLGDRFDSPVVTVLASLTFTVAMILFLAVVLYTPAFAFEAVTGLDKDITQIACGLVCTVYVVLGGFRAVIWTDTVQMMIIIGSTLTVAIIGADKIEGDQSVWDIAKEDNRINFDKDDTDLTERHTVWTQCIGQVFSWLPIMVANQMLIQRYSAVSTNRRAWIAACVAIGTTIVIMAMVTACGLVMYATFRDCDPFAVAKQVDEPDQLFPLFMMRVLGDYKGLPGLYVAAVFAAALSSVSSAINSLAAVFLEDFIRPVYSCCTTHTKDLSEARATWITRILSLLLGFLTIGLSYIAPHMGDELIEIPPTIWGSIMAPLLGVFVLAMFFPCANAIGASCALILTLTFSMWMTVGGIMYGRDRLPLMPLGFCRPPMGNANPEVTTFTMQFEENATYTEMQYTTTEMQYTTAEMQYTTAEIQYTTMQDSLDPTPKTTDEPALEDFYSVSYAWYGLINLVMCVLLGCIISCAVNLIRHGSLGIPQSARTREVNDWWTWFRNHVRKKGAVVQKGSAYTQGGSHVSMETPGGKQAGITDMNQFADNPGYDPE